MAELEMVAHNALRATGILLAAALLLGAVVMLGYWLLKRRIRRTMAQLAERELRRLRQAAGAEASAEPSGGQAEDAAGEERAS